MDSDSDSENLSGLNKYFSVNAETNLVHCTVLDCKQKFKNWKKYNLKRHLQTKHESCFKQLYPEKMDKIQNLQIKALEMRFSAVELVTINGQPFSLLNASAIKNFCKTDMEELREKRYEVKMSRKSIAKDIDDFSREIVEMLKEEIKDQLICLMLDGCTKGTLSVLSLNAQYMINDEIIVRSLGVFELTNRHTAVFIATTVKNYIETTFDISIRQVKAVVTDNAPAMLLTRKLLNMMALGESIDEYIDVSEDEINLDDCETDENSEVNGISPEDELEIANIVTGVENYGRLVTNFATEFASYYGTVITVNPINCSTHTYQLGIRDTFSICDVSSIIDTVNDLCKLLRTQVVQIAFKHMGLKVIKPHMNNKTRWNSEYMMVSFERLS